MMYADFRIFLKDKTSFKEEYALFESLFKDCKILITPGQHCLASQPGFFRIIFTRELDESLPSEIEKRLKVWAKKYE